MWNKELSNIAIISFNCCGEMGLGNSKLTTWLILRAKLGTRLACWWKKARVWEVYVRGELGSVYVVPLKVKVRGLQVQKLTLAREATCLN